MRTKILATVMVAVMMMSGFCVMAAGSSGSDASVWEPNDAGDYYSITMTYHQDQMTETAAPELQLTVEMSTPISNDGTVDEGTWGFDPDTGIGPFNSFYAAFDIDDNNRMVAKLNPMDLSETIDGEPLDTTKRYNIMWVLPTVYWLIGENVIDDTTYPTLILTNDSTAGGIAYAHTINGHTYNYVAYGVYEGYVDTIASGESTVSVLTSQTGVNPSHTINRDTFRTYAHNYDMDSDLSADGPAYSMLWNFYQWELYKYCSLIAMECWDAQSTIGNGKVYTSNNNVRYNLTGITDQLGPFSGTVGDATISSNDTNSAKLFIENAWGSLAEFVDGVVFNYTSIYNAGAGTDTVVDVYIQSSSTPDNYYGGSTGTDSYVEVIEFSSRYADGQESLPNLSQLTPAVITPGSTAQLMDISPIDDPSENIMEQSGYPLYVVTDDPRVWGIGSTIGGSASIGLTDYELEPSAIGPKVVSVGSRAINGLDQVFWAGLSSLNTESSLNFVHLSAGTRLAFVFDVDPTATDQAVAFTVSNGSIISNGVSVSSVDVPLGSFVSADGAELTIGTETFTATPLTNTAQYTYAFDSWSGLPEGRVTGPLDISAVITATVNEYTVTIQSSDTEKGTVSVSEITVPYGTRLTVNGNTMTIGDTVITATPAEGLEAKWRVWTNTITGDLSITVDFETPQSPAQKLMSFIPLIVIFGIIMLAASAIASFKGTGFDMVKLMIGLAVCILILVFALLPAAGGL